MPTLSSVDASSIGKCSISGTDIMKSFDIDVSLNDNNYYSKLRIGHKGFVDLLPEQIERMVISLPNISDCQVFYLSVKCIAESVSDLDNLGKSIDILFAEDVMCSESVDFRPYYCNGEFVYTITNSMGISPGKYTISIHHSGKIENPIVVSASAKIVDIVNSKAIVANSLIHHVFSNEKVCYLRYVHSYKGKMISIRLDCEGEVDMYISNRHNGLIPIDKDSTVWKYLSIVGNNRFDILPSDPNLGTSDIFTICIMDRSNNFRNNYNNNHNSNSNSNTEGSKFRLSISPAEMLVPMELSPSQNKEFTVFPGRIQYLSFNIRSMEFFAGLIIRISSQEMRLNYPLHTGVSIPNAICGKYVFPFLPMGHTLFEGDPSKYFKSAPSIYASCSTQFPSMDSHIWKGLLAEDGCFYFYIHGADFLYANYSHVYFSIQINSIGSQPPSAQRFYWDSWIIEPHLPRIFPSSCRVHEDKDVYLHAELDRNTSSWKSRYELFRELYWNVDGFEESIRSRSKSSQMLSFTEDRSLHYGEAHFHALTSLFDSLSLNSGLVFVDVGCGIGKTMVAIALSSSNLNLRFARLEGIEINQNLVEIGKKIVQEMYHRAGGLGIDNLPLIDLICGDALVEKKWTQGDIIFLSSLGFSIEVLRGLLMAICTSARSGTLILAFKLPSGFENRVELVGKYSVEMSWGISLVSVFRVV